MEHRKNEVDRVWFRTGRVFRSNGLWYFHTREGVDVGPYATEFEAEVESELLKQTLKDADATRAITTIREFMMESTMMTGGLSDSVFTDYVVRESSTNLTLKTLLGG